MTLTVNGTAVTTARIRIGSWGVWWADVNLSDPQSLAGKVTIDDDGAHLIGTIISGGVSTSGASYRIVGGAGGWRKEVGPVGHQNAAGCTFSSIAIELASEVGETLENPPRTALGPHYARRGSTAASKVFASDVLNHHFPRAWHVGDDGVTRFVARNGGAYSDPAAVIEPANGLGIVRISADSGAKIRPGIMIDGARIGDVDLHYSVTRVTAYCHPEAGQQADILGQLTERVLVRVRFLGCYEYRANDCDGAYLLNVEPIDPTLGLPTLEKVGIRPPAGYRSSVASGAKVALMFLDGNPARPVVLGATESDDNDSDSVTIGSVNASDYVALATKTDQAISDVVSATSTALGAIAVAAGSAFSGAAICQAPFDISTATIQSVAASHVRAS